jgi:DNA repair exonuclease SbcCD ATPase subunit
MNLLSVTLENFLIISKATIALQNRGLVRIAGENTDDTTSISNGSGKSTLIEGIYWGLFGDSLRNLKSSDDVVNRTVGKNCSVVLEFEEGETSYRVERYRKHSKKKNNLYLYINDVDSRGKDNRETQTYIEDIVGMDKTSFSNSIVFGQGHSKNLKRFSEMTDSEKKATLEKVLSLEVFGKAFDKTKEKLSELETGIALKRQALESLETKLVEMAQQTKDASQGLGQFEDRRNSRIADVLGERDALLRTLEDLDQNLVAIKSNHTSIEELDQTMEACEELLADQMKEIDSLKEGIGERKTKILSTTQSINADIQRHKKQLDSLSDGSDAGGRCEYCASVIVQTNLDHERDGLEFEIEDRERSVKSLNTELETLVSEYEKKRESVDAIIGDINDVIKACKSQQATFHTTQRHIDRMELEVKHAQTTADDKAQQAKDIETEDNPWKSIVANLETATKGLEAEKEGFKEAFSEYEEELKILSFWRTAFSRQGIRSFLLDKIVPFLNERVAHYLAILTDGGITAKFSTVKRLASGEYRENFNLEVTNRHASESYEGNSGGEKRRIDLAVALAFNDFLASRSGKRFNILLLDEVFEGVDAEGLYYVIKVLEDLARRKSSVFVITHRDELKSYFSDEILVKREAGLSLVA